MNLLETLSLALALECNLELKGNEIVAKPKGNVANELCDLAIKGEKIVAKPKENVTDELIRGIKENRSALIEHLKKVEEEEGYKLISDIVSAGVTLEYDTAGNLTGGRPAEAINIALKDRIKRFKPWISGIKKARDKGIKSEAEFVLMARERFPDREPYERPLTKEEFFYGERRRLGESA